MFRQCIFAVSGVSLCLVTACSSGSSGDSASTSDGLTSDADSITRRSDGKYDVLCRDGHTEIVTVAQIQSDQVCQPAQSDDPFDPGACTGAPMTTAAAHANLDIPNGILSRQFGRFQLLQRERDCYADFSCSTWRSGGPDMTAPFPKLSSTFTSRSTEARFRFYLTGDVLLEYRSNAPTLTFKGDPFHASWGASLTPSAIDQWLAPVSVDPTVAAASSDVSIAYNWQPSRGCPNGHCAGNDSVPGTTRATLASAPLTLSGNVAASCLRLAAGAKVPSTDSHGNAYTRETEVVLFSKLGTTCAATTCAAQRANCGAVPDGCGGTLDCGGCSNTDDTCGGRGTPNQCGNHLTPSDLCARQGKVYCQGRGCYDACF